LATLSVLVTELTLPMYSSICFGLFPALTISVGFSINLATKRYLLFVWVLFCGLAHNEQANRTGKVDDGGPAPTSCSDSGEKSTVLCSDFKIHRFHADLKGSVGRNGPLQSIEFA
jgi:hypothetical protein